MAFCVVHPEGPRLEDRRPKTSRTAASSEQTNFNKSQPPQFPQHLGGGRLSHNPDYHKTPPPPPPPPLYSDIVLYSKTNLLNSPNMGGGVLSHNSDYHKTPPTPLQ